MNNTNLPPIIFFSCPELPGSGFLVCTDAPYIMGRVIKSEEQSTIEDYMAKPVSFAKEKVPGYNIVVVEAGYFTPPTNPAPDHQINDVIKQMASWFCTHKVETNKVWRKRYFTKNN